MLFFCLGYCALIKKGHKCYESADVYLVSTSDFNQMCYCCRKLENLNIFIEMYRSASNVQLSDWLRERILYI